jgi:maltokinase
MTPVSALLGPLREWLPRQRWFAAKGRSIAELSVAQSATLRAGEPRGELLVLAAEFDDDGPTEYYQLLLGLRSSTPQVLRHVTIGTANGLTAYDGLWDPELSGELLTLLAEGASRQWLRFVPEPDVRIPTGLPPRVLSAEQSNTSVVFGDELMFKLFRRVAPGMNPDLELHRALHSVHSQEVAGLRAAVEGTLGGEPAVFGMMQEFAANSAEGWSMALLSIRDLFAEADLRADEVGGDFAGDACRLGKTVAVMHAELVKALGSGTMSARSLADGMRQRLDRALPVVPGLGELAGELGAAFDAVVELGELPIQRIHGDLHLGQTLRTPKGWLLIDFEGEPARPLAQRRAMEPALRDVAGILRSFDYAAYHQLAEWGEWANPGDAEPDAHLVWHAEEWANRNREAFCDGYADAAGEDPRAYGALLRALELDKAVYETVYETRNRPGWLQVPLRSMRRLLTASNRP